MVEEEFLFGIDVDHVVWIDGVQMADGDALDGFGGRDEMTIDARAMGHRVGVEEEDLASHGVRRVYFSLEGREIQ